MCVYRCTCMYMYMYKHGSLFSVSDKCTCIYVILRTQNWNAVFACADRHRGGILIWLPHASSKWRS